jgi:hypothetical protein
VAGPKHVVLSTPIKSHRGELIKEIVLRAPVYRDLMTLGMPSTWVVLPGGGGFEQESFPAIEEWVNRLVDMDVNLLELLSLKDSLALRAAVRDFFFAAAGATELKSSTDLPGASPSSAEPTSGPLHHLELSEIEFWLKAWVEHSKERESERRR